MSNDTERTGPLKGMLVLDFTTVVSGPVCAQMLYDNGARVIKIERPGVGDSIRGATAPLVHGLFTDVMGINGGKESIEADLKNPNDLALLKRIIKKADILVENFRPGAMANSGLSYDEVKKINPKIIYASISGYGQSGPRHQDPAYDIIIQSASGFIEATGRPDLPGIAAGSSVADITSGMLAFSGIMTALFDRERTGRGAHVDISMLEGMMMLLTEPVCEYTATGKVPKRRGNDHPATAPFSTYKTGGKDIAMAMTTQTQWAHLCKILQKPEWLEKPEYKGLTARRDNKDMLRAELEPILKTQDHTYWLEKFEAVGVPVSVVQTVADACAMEQQKARGFFVDVDGFKYNGNPILLSSYPRITKRPRAPELGQHSDAIRKEFAA
jgi:CoA:oxalate CoA-transferase